MKEGFYFENTDEAMKFFEACDAAGAVTYEERLAIMRMMVKNKKAGYIRDVDEFAKGKDVLKIMPKELE